MAGLMGAVHCDSSATYRQNLMITTTRLFKWLKHWNCLRCLNS